jgi:hypothetical protein
MVDESFSSSGRFACHSLCHSSSNNLCLMRGVFVLSAFVTRLRLWSCETATCHCCMVGSGNVVHLLMFVQFMKTGSRVVLADCLCGSGIGAIVACSLRSMSCIAHWMVVVGTLHCILSYKSLYVHPFLMCRFVGSPKMTRILCRVGECQTGQIGSDSGLPC